MKIFGPTETKLFHFIGYLKRGVGRGQANPLNPRLGSPLQVSGR